MTLIAYISYIATVAEAMRGGRDNQEYFGKVEAPSDPPR